MSVVRAGWALRSEPPAPACQPKLSLISIDTAEMVTEMVAKAGPDLSSKREEV